MNARELLSIGAIGLRTRRLRAALSALGIAIGISAIVAGLGISASSQANLLDQIDALGTNLLTVSAGNAVLGGQAQLAQSAVGKIAHINGVGDVAGLYQVPNAAPLRSNYISSLQTGGLGVEAAGPALLATLRGQLTTGTFLSSATANYPSVVLGATVARQLGITSLARHPLVYIQGQWFSVIGVMRSLPLAPELDNQALIGLPVAQRTFGIRDAATTIYVRADTNAVSSVRALLASSANPEHPEVVQVSRPSDALAAHAAAQGSYDTLLLGLGAIALLVGGVGIANVMIISVIERRGEIGLRRALGATRHDIAAQFLTESLVLSLIGGTAGAALGIVVSAAYATANNLPTVISELGLGGRIAAALVIGAIAGVYPGLRAAALAPTEALRAV
jgi:putative ABC transport system permease protein